MATSTTDIISAAQALDPASRAVLNLWLRGRDDATIARLAGGSPEEIAARRDRLVAVLGRETGAAPEEIRASIDQMAGPGAGVPASSPPAARAKPEPERVPEPEPSPDPEPPAPRAEPEPAPPLPALAPPAPLASMPPPVPLAPPGVPVLLDEPGPAAAEPEARELVLPGEPDPDAASAQPPELVLPGEPEGPRAGTADLVVPGEPEIGPPGEEPELIVAPEGAATAERPKRTRIATDAGADADAASQARPERPAGDPLPGTLAVAVGLVLLVLIVLSALSGGGEEASGDRPPAAAAPPSEPGVFQPVAPGLEGASGTATIAGQELALEVSGLPRARGEYEVWLFNAVADAQSLGRLDEARFRLPPGYEDFRSIDVSLETDGDPAHGDRSVLRTPLPRP